MNSIIIYNQPDGSVAYVIPCGETPIDEVQKKDVPQGVESEIVEREKVLPVDEYFRDAWTWAGKGQPVLEDLEKSKAIACEQVKTATRSEIKVVMEAELLGDPTPKTIEELQAECAAVVEQINTANSVDEIKTVLGN